MKIIENKVKEYSCSKVIKDVQKDEDPLLNDSCRIECLQSQLVIEGRFKNIHNELGVDES